MLQFRVLIATLTIALLHAPLKADLESDVNRFAKPFVKSGNLVALTIGVIQGGKQHITGFGETVAGNKTKPNADTFFEIGSISKVFTGILLAEMVQRGELKLDDPVAKHLPKYFAIPNYESTPITLLNLSSHGSSLPRMPSNFAPKNPRNPYADYTLKQMASFLKTVKLSRKPGSKYGYSNLAVGLLGNAMAHRAGKSFEALLKERVVLPLGLKDATITLSDKQKKLMAQGYNAALLPASNWDLPTFAAAGGVRSTTRDMMRFVKANLSGKAKIEAALQLSYQSTLKLPDGRQAMGLGWHIAGDGSTYWHNGQTGGYHAFVAFNRKTNVGVVICVTGNPLKVDQLGFRLVRHLSGDDVQPITFPEPANIDTKVYDQYVGKYQLFPQFSLNVIRRNHHLYVQATNQQALEVFPKAKDKFFYKAVEATIEFHRNEKGKVTHLTLFQNGRKMKGPRVK